MESTISVESGYEKPKSKNDFLTAWTIASASPWVVQNRRSGCSLNCIALPERASPQGALFVP